MVELTASRAEENVDVNNEVAQRWLLGRTMFVVMSCGGMWDVGGKPINKKIGEPGNFLGLGWWRRCGEVENAGGKSVCVVCAIDREENNCRAASQRGRRTRTTTTSTTTRRRE